MTPAGVCMATRKSTRSKTKKTRRTRTTNRPTAPTERPVRDGFISHTEFASADPPATRVWCETVFGWKFGDPAPTPVGPYEMWAFDNKLGGGGIRKKNPSEPPGTVPYVEVRDIKDAYNRALKAGATEMAAPGEIPGGMGWIAIVQAPGGVAVGFWGPK
jgi:predicted enzyme related to lactoylglutathione lyase